jgi:coenzyme PQQ synthesis protein D (PqqD)
MLLETKCVVIPKDVMAREVGEEVVILNLDNEQYYGLDEVGTGMWSALTSAPNIKAALELLQAEYDVEPQELSHDLQEFIDKLVAEGLLEIHDV